MHICAWPCFSGILLKVSAQWYQSWPGFFFFFFFCIPQLYLWASPFWVRFLRMWSFFDPTIEVVTFCLCGWCIWVCFVAGIHPSRIWMPGSFESVWWNACVHRLDLSLYFHPKVFWGNGVRTHVNSKRKISSTTKIHLRWGSNPWCCIKQDSEPNTLPMSNSSPHLVTFGPLHSYWQSLDFMLRELGSSWLWQLPSWNATSALISTSGNFESDMWRKPLTRKYVYCSFYMCLSNRKKVNMFKQLNVRGWYSWRLCCCACDLPSETCSHRVAGTCWLLLWFLQCNVEGVEQLSRWCCWARCPVL